MPNFCSIVVCGHLGRDANLKDVNGQSVLEFSVAYNAKKDDPPTWFNCAIWGDRGKKLAAHLSKGTAVIVSGTLNPRTYQSKKDGGERTSLDIRVDQFSFAGSKGEQIPAPSGDASSDAARELFLEKQAETPPDEDIPF